MLHSYDDLRHYAVRAADERKGHVDDLYFDDQSWAIRYLVVHTGFLFSARQSLIRADLLSAPEVDKREFPVSVKAEDIENAPPPESHEPVSARRDRRFAMDLALWPPFLIGFDEARYTPLVAETQIMHHLRDADPTEDADQNRSGTSADPHLRSMYEVSGYRVVARDEEFGSVVDFLIDPESWQLRYVVVDTGAWLPGKRVVITTGHVSGIDAEAGSIHVDIDKADVESAKPLASVEDLKRSSYQEFAEQYGTGGMWPVGL
jgi:uncharacterized protein YrrD